MKLRKLATFDEGFQRLPPEIKERAQRKFRLFAQDSAHKSLRIKKMRGYDNIWEGHISRGYVFTFSWDNDQQTGERIAVLRKIGTHAIYNAP